MELKEVKELLAAFDKSESSYFSLEQDGIKIKLKKPSDNAMAQAVVAAPVQMTGAPTIAMANNTDGQTTNVAATNEMNSEALTEAIEGEQVLAPLVGVFYAAASPEAEAYVQVGDKVKAGQVLCLIEAMKMMSEVTSPKEGVVKKIYVKNQDVVGFEDPLFLIGD